MFSLIEGIITAAVVLAVLGPALIWLTRRIMWSRAARRTDSLERSRREHMIADRAGLAPLRSETEEVRTRTSAEPGAAQAAELSPAQQHAQKMNDLQRRYVADEITVEQYEAELDRLMRE